MSTYLIRWPNKLFHRKVDLLPHCMICVQKYQDFVPFFYQVAISMLFVEKYIHIEIM